MATHLQFHQGEVNKDKLEKGIPEASWIARPAKVTSSALSSLRDPTSSIPKVKTHTFEHVYIHGCTPHAKIRL